MVSVDRRGLEDQIEKRLIEEPEGFCGHRGERGVCRRCAGGHGAGLYTPDRMRAFRSGAGVRTLAAMGSDKPLTYWDYIRVEELVGLQGGAERNEADLGNEEVMFITVHQIFELWFKLILRELRTARDLFDSKAVANQKLSGAVRSLDRVITIFGRAVDHFLVMETLTTRDYLAFRDKLTSASGFQSAQMREIEIVMGLDSSERLDAGPAGNWMDMLRNQDGSPSWSLHRVLGALDERRTLKEAIDRWLVRTPIDGVEHDDPRAGVKLEEFIEAFLSAHSREVDAVLETALAREEGGAVSEARKLRSEQEKATVRAF